MFERVPKDDGQGAPWPIARDPRCEGHDTRESQDFLTKLVGNVQRVKLPFWPWLPAVEHAPSRTRNRAARFAQAVVRLLSKA